MSKLDEKITLYRNKLQLHPQGHLNHAKILHELAGLLYDRFSEREEVADLDEALALNQELLSLLPEGHPDRATSMGNMANCLHGRFIQFGIRSDLDEALALDRKVFEFFPLGHPRRVTSLSNLANSLHSRFVHFGALSDLDEALTLQRNALELCPEGHPDRATSLCSLASYLKRRYVKLGRLSDLDEALALERNALELRPQGHSYRALSLDGIAGCLHDRFLQLGMLSDLDEAICLERNVLGLRPKGHPGRAMALGNLAVYLHDRFRQLRTLSDLDEALVLQRDALELRPEGHPRRATSLDNLANFLRSRFRKLATLPDIDEAIALGRDAMELRPKGHTDRAASLCNVATCLHDRFRYLETLSDLDESLALQREALELRPLGHPDRADSLSNIANCLSGRFELLGLLSDLDESLVFQRNALDLSPEGNPNRAYLLSSVAHYLQARFEHSAMHDISDLQEAFRLYSQLSDITHSVSSADLHCAKRWIEAAEKYNHSTTVLAYQTFLRLHVYHLATLPSLPQHLALVKQLAAHVAVDAFSACVRYGNHINAIELLEQGRGVFWSQLIRLRSPLDEVTASGDTGKRLADKFTQVSSLLHSVLDATSDAQSQHDRACRLNIELQDIVADIRKLPSLSCFLQPSPFSDLQAAAASGPVIIVNASQYTCDALVLLSDRDPVHVALRISKARVSQLSRALHSLTLRAKFMDMTREFVVLLRELWDVVVFPIVEVLREVCPPRSRIWWCPTAEFSLLPLHAAGTYRKSQLKLSDLYISSYTPTLTALIRARPQRPLDPSMEQHQFLVVGQAQAPGQNKLTSVDTELSGISKRIGSIATITCVQGQDANIAKVAEELNKHHFVHLACHGIPDQQHPFESGFALGDGLLRVEDIMRYDLRHAQFAYLSACHTTVGDEESPDEVLHLAAAMQFAGFRSVIGTMWAVDDAHTNLITSRFYEYMVDESGRLDHTRAALALHRTMRSIRSRDIPFDQRILYIHIGA